MFCSQYCDNSNKHCDVFDIYAQTNLQKINALSHNKIQESKATEKDQSQNQAKRLCHKENKT